MNNIEFSNEFDTLINSYSNINQFGLSKGDYNLEFDEYEKSVFLTKAQEDIIQEIYKGNNILGESFEKTEDIKRSLDGLIKTFETSEKKTGIGLSPLSVFFRLPLDLWFITYERVRVLEAPYNKDYLIVIPTTQDDYYRVSNNPFKKENHRRALRLDSGDGNVEIISEYTVTSYLIRYISRPDPIILIDLPTELSINNINKKSECSLNSILHRFILERAVKLALISRTNIISNK